MTDNDLLTRCYFQLKLARQFLQKVLDFCRDDSERRNLDKELADYDETIHYIKLRVGRQIQSMEAMKDYNPTPTEDIK